MPTSPSGQSRGPKKHSRIVINVDQLRKQEQAARRGGLHFTKRSQRLTIVLGAVLLVSAAVGAAVYRWWQGYRSGPTYSLALLAHAARGDDADTVGEMVDVDLITQNLVPQVMEKLIKSTDVSRMSPARRQAEASVTQLLPGVRETMREEITRGIKESAARAGNWPFFILVLAVPRAVDQVKEEGDRAIVRLEAGDRPVELTMRRAGDRWKIIGVKDEALATQIADRVAKNLPGAPGGPARQ